MTKTIRQQLVVLGMLLPFAAPIFAQETIVDGAQDPKHRFQIFIAEHNAVVNGKPISMKSIFKIDLETGTVWRYRQGVDSKGKPFEEFFEVPNQ